MHCAIREEVIMLGNHPFTDLDNFAKADGFESFEDMKYWFRYTHGLPFIGRLTQWADTGNGTKTESVVGSVVGGNWGEGDDL